MDEQTLPSLQDIEFRLKNLVESLVETNSVIAELVSKSGTPKYEFSDVRYRLRDCYFYLEDICCDFDKVPTKFKNNQVIWF